MRTSASLRDLAEEDPLEIEASKFSLNYIRLDGNDRLHGQRRRPGDGDDGHHQAGGRRAGQLPRRRRRRERGADPERVQDPDGRREREGGADQHLRRHPPLRRARVGRHRRGQGTRRQSADRRAHGRHQRRRGQADARESGLNFTSADGMGDAADESGRARRDGRESTGHVPWPFFSTSPRVCSCRA